MKVNKAILMGSKLAITLVLLSCTNAVNEMVPISENYAKNTVQYKTVAGVESNLLSLDIYHFGETTNTKPVVVYVHGGGFAVGDKANKMVNKENLFFSLNYVLVSINYRLSPSVYSVDPDRIMYPTHHNDVADAIKWIFENIDSYGGDNQKIALLGHSAGAQLVALTGTSNQFLPTRGIKVNQLKGVACIDTEGYDVVARGTEGNQVYLNAFGQEDTFWFEASPINNVSAGIHYPNFFIAKRGSKRRIGYSDAFISKLKSVGVSVRELTASQYDHEGINNAIGAKGENIVTEPLIVFFAECFE